MTNQNHRVAFILGDGIGTEVLPPARRFPKVPVPYHDGTASFLPFGGAYCKAEDKSF
ncbi:isocitrate/isopropylmalate dehydrogenase [Streptomyces luteogriseus]|uniref:hypothetical protein n=1 Tax=Streptomyces luteogriseus TaxID=68233 RepID=UPI0027850B65|nr:hypothetical protein [Streptomyces luteogriseus]MDQ0718362.1 isocitrate/isopropylmalate dehydrogenase [Streptomyces luteogriseus]